MDEIDKYIKDIESRKRREPKRTHVPVKFQHKIKPKFSIKGSLSEPPFPIFSEIKGRNMEKFKINCF